MSLTYYWQSKQANILQVSQSGRFTETMQRLFGTDRTNWTINRKHLELLRGARAAFGGDWNIFDQLIRLLDEHAEIQVWGE